MIFEARAYGKLRMPIRVQSSLFNRFIDVNGFLSVSQMSVDSKQIPTNFLLSEPRAHYQVNLKYSVSTIVTL